MPGCLSMVACMQIRMARQKTVGPRVWLCVGIVYYRYNISSSPAYIHVFALSPRIHPIFSFASTLPERRGSRHVGHIYGEEVTQ